MAFLPVDVAAYLTIADGLKKLLDLNGISGHLHLYPPICQVPHPSADVKAHGFALCGVAETDALHTSFVEDLFCCHGVVGKG